MRERIYLFWSAYKLIQEWLDTYFPRSTVHISSQCRHPARYCYERNGGAVLDTGDNQHNGAGEQLINDFVCYHIKS